MNYLLSHWNYRISFWLTLLTGVLLLWQYPAAKGGAGHVGRWAAALALSVFVVYMNTLVAGSRPHPPIVNPRHIGFMTFHQNVGLIYFALMAVMPFFGGALFWLRKRPGRWPRAVRRAHRWLAYAAGITWLVSNIASEIGSRIPTI